MDQFVKRVRETGIIVDKPTRVHNRPVRSTENIAVMAENVRVQPTTSTRNFSQQLDNSRTLKSWVDRIGYCKASRGGPFY